MIYYVMTDELVVLHSIDLSEGELIAVNQQYSVLDEDTVNQMIADGEDVTMPVNDGDTFQFGALEF